MDFDSSLSLEESYYQAGWDEGSRDGAVQGLIEGRIYGSEISFERYLAVGQLFGRLTLWKQSHIDNPRMMRHIGKVEELFDRMPRDNAETAEGQDYESVLAAVTGKMRVIASLCGGESLAKQGLEVKGQIQDGNADVEDGAELAVQLRGGQRRGCASES